MLPVVTPVQLFGNIKFLNFYNAKLEWAGVARKSARVEKSKILAWQAYGRSTHPVRPPITFLFWWSVGPL